MKVSFKELILLVFLSGCAAVNVQPTYEVTKTYRFAAADQSQTDLLGLGPGAVYVVRFVPDERRIKFSSDVLLTVLQNRNFSVNGLSVDHLLAPGAEWSTETVPIDGMEIAKHNASNPAMKLPSLSYGNYGLSLSGIYKLENERLTFEFHAKLYKGTRQSGWIAISDPYSGKFFIDEISTALDAGLRGS